MKVRRPRTWFAPFAVAVACTPLQESVHRDAAVADGPCESGVLNDDSNCGRCGAACGAGDACLAGTCAPATRAPRLIAPASGATVPAQRPRLRWELSRADGSDGARVELCRDRAMSVGCLAFDLVGSAGPPPRDLSPGLWYWRATARTGVVTTRATSAVWRFRVGRVDSSRGSTLDLDGDGRAELVAGAPRVNGNSGAVYLFVRVLRSGTTPWTVRRGRRSSEFGLSAASAGDVNGDGFMDLVVGAPGANEVHVFLGVDGGLAATPAVLTGGSDLTRYGEVVAGAGDVNGDGYDDIVVAARSVDGAPGRVLVYLGGEGGVSETPAATLTPQGDPSPNVVVDGVGDVNGDGFEDVALGSSSANGNAGRVYLFHGGPGGLSERPATALEGGDVGGRFGLYLARAGDVNGDGFADLFVCAPYVLNRTGRLLVFHGGAAGLITRPATTLTGAAEGAGLGGGVARGADRDGDGYSDLLVGATGYPMGLGSASFHRGSAAGIASAQPVVRTGVEGNSNYGFTASIAGDLDGDGLGDLVVSAVGSVEHTGRLYVYLGEAGGVSEVPIVVNGSGGPQGVFGWTIARARSRRRGF